MNMALSQSRLGIAYGVALVLHGLVVAFLGIAGICAAFAMAGFANAMRSNLLAGGITLITTLLPAIPSVFALLSFDILRRRAQRPSKGHMIIAITSAVLIWALFLVVMVTT